MSLLELMAVKSEGREAEDGEERKESTEKELGGVVDKEEREGQPADLNRVVHALRNAGH